MALRRNELVVQMEKGAVVWPGGVGLNWLSTLAPPNVNKSRRNQWTILSLAYHVVKLIMRSLLRGPCRKWARLHSCADFCFRPENSRKNPESRIRNSEIRDALIISFSGTFGIRRFLRTRNILLNKNPKFKFKLSLSHF